MKHPALLSASISKRLIPRRERMIAAGVSFSKPTTRIMCGFSNDKFDDWIYRKEVPSNKYDSKLT